MAEDEIIEVNNIDTIIAPFSPLDFVMVGANTHNHDPANLILTRTINNKEPITHRSDLSYIVMVGMVVADSHNMGCWTTKIKANRTAVGITENNSITTTDAKACVTEVLHIRHGHSSWWLSTYQYGGNASPLINAPSQLLPEYTKDWADQIQTETTPLQ